MIPEPINNDRLTLDEVPEPTADWDATQRVALTYDGYEANGSFEACADIANGCRHDSLSDLRTCLFFEKRSWRHSGDKPNDEAMTYIRDLIRKIRAALRTGDGDGRL